MIENSAVVQDAPSREQETSTPQIEKSGYHACAQSGISTHSTKTLPSKFGLFREIEASSLHHDSIKRFVFLLFGDVFAVFICFALSWSLSVAARQLLDTDPLAAELLTRQLSIEIFFLIPVCVIVSSSIYWGHYTQSKPIWNEQLEVIKASIFAIASGLVVLYLSKRHISRLWLVSFWLCVPICIPVMRTTLKKLMMLLHFWYRPVVVIGTGRNALATAQMLQSEPLMGYTILSFVDIGAGSTDSAFANSDIVHGLKNRLDIQNRFGHVDVLFAMDTLEEMDEQKKLIDDFICSSSVRTMVAPPLNGLSLYGADIISVFKHDNIFLSFRSNLGNWRHKVSKRIFDIVVSMCLLIILSPLFVILFVIIKLDRGPAFYASKRVGTGGEIFNCLKFRSMAVDSSALLANLLKNDHELKEKWNRDFKLDHDPRVTRIGRFIRKTSLDELPQLWNVLIGEMSLVGPRPILPEELEQYGDNIKFYMITRPGITGLWQVSGRNNLTYSQRIELNLWYTKNWSLWNDIIILLKTIPIATRGSGAS